MTELECIEAQRSQAAAIVADCDRRIAALRKPPEKFPVGSKAMMPVTVVEIDRRQYAADVSHLVDFHGREHWICESDLLPATPTPTRCPRCDSPNPLLHPAVQFEGEVQECYHEWHGGKPSTVVNMNDAEDAIRKITDERDKLQAFKDYVHGWLDTIGIPTHPDGPHSKEGCRIGDRLDLAFMRAPTPKWATPAVTRERIEVALQSLKIDCEIVRIPALATALADALGAAPEPPKPAVEVILASIENLPLLEVKALAEALAKKLGIMAAPPVSREAILAALNKIDDYYPQISFEELATELAARLAEPTKGATP